MANKKDYATSTVLTAPSPADSGTSLVVQSGHGARFPAAPFYVTVHPPGEFPTLDNAEKLLVSSKSTDTFTISRAQGDTTAKNIEAGWRVSNALFLDDIPDTFDDLADGTTNKAFTSTEKTKLAGIATGATANTGDVVGAASSTTNSLAVYSSGTGKAITDSYLLHGSNMGWVSLGSIGAANELRLETNSGANDKPITANGAPIVTTTATQTLTNKTLTAPVLSGTLTGTYTIGGTPTFPSSVATLTGTQTLTNKTLTSPVINTSISGTAVLDEDDMSSNSSTKVATQQSTKAYVDARTPQDGWTSPGETWTYASASTFTVSGDKTTTYTKGTRLKWTQTSVKYGVIINSSYSSGTGLTTVTIAVNTNYTISNAAISSNYYSYMSNPRGYPQYFSFTAAITCPGGTAPTYSNNSCNFAVNGGTVTVTYSLSNTSGGTAGTSANPLFISTPIRPSTASRCGFGSAYNGGTAINGFIIYDFMAVTDPANDIFYIGFRGYNITGADQNNASRYIQITLTYQMA